MRQVRVIIAGQNFQIRSDAEEEHIQALANEITQRFNAMVKRGPRQSPDVKALAMISMSLLDELLNIKQELALTKRERKHLQVKVRQFADRIVEKIDLLLTGDSS
jgi:cell division protein ZapA (FtsZ GTPase activity inhibitor)